MRIISGRYKRRVISPPNDLPVRPTTDMAKESLFNVLSNYVDFSEKTVLDLYAGTGNISYEFVSRGCSSVTAVDKDFGCTKFIIKTAQQLEMKELNVTKLDASRFIETAKNKYDIIFADPPYKLTNIDFSGLLHFYEHRKYGRGNFSFFQLEGEQKRL